MLKRCFKCGNQKPRTEFYAHAQMGDGLLGKCKECTRVDVRANRASRPEHYKRYEQRRAMAAHRVVARKHYASTPSGKAAIARAHRSYKGRFPERDAARNAVNNALRDGRLMRQLCWICGEKAEAHHPDYSQPLDVVWLCNEHHRAAHKVAA